MKRLSILAGAMLIAAGAASAQLNINVPTREPKTNLVSAEWARMEKGFIDARTIIGKPEIFVVNATFDEITVSCSKWDLVGPNLRYNKTNPSSIRPFTVVLIETKDFDNTCKEIIAHTLSGDTFTGVLSSSDGTFTNATFVTFLQPPR